MLSKRIKLPALKNNYPLQAFLLNLITAAVCFGIFVIINGGRFAVAGDFNVQQIPFAMHANDAVKSGRVFWDWSLDLGSSFIGGMTFYLLGNPSFWLSLLFPSDAFIFIVGWIYVLKYAFAGLTAFYWLRRHIRSGRSAVIASMLYAFSGYMHEDLLFYHFHDVVMLFPLLLLTLDMLIEEDRHGPFIFAVTLNVLVNYFFFPGEVIFLAAYFILRHVMDGGRKVWRRLPYIFAEGIIGCMIGALLLLPSAIFVMQNPRVKFDYVGSNSLVFGADRYLFILKSMIFPGEVMSDHSALISHNFASCAAYLPMVGMVFVIAFLIMKQYRRHWITRMLKFCLVMAVIPIFNASFSMFAGLYYRWYYMPVLLFALASGIVLDHLETEREVFEYPSPSDTAVSKATIIWIAVTAFFIAFLAFVPWNSQGESKIFRADLFAAWSCVSLSGTMLTWILATQIRLRGKRGYIHRLIGAGVILYGAGTLIAAIALYNVANVEDARHLHDRIVTSGAMPDPSPSYRYTNRDNPETLTHGYPASANFCSTVQGSIFRFYESLGLKRDVKSPDAPEGLMELISAAYTYETSERKDEEALVVIDGRYRKYYIYLDEDIPPIGFTYDSYITESEFESITEENKCAVMLRTLVIPDGKEEAVADVLAHLDIGEAEKMGIADIPELGRSHLDECAADAVRTKDSYSVTIDSSADKYAFFSIPNDSGWRAYVDGEESEIIDVNGFMAVRIAAGSNRIELKYAVPGLPEGGAMSVAGLILAAVYIVIMRQKKRAKAA